MTALRAKKVNGAVHTFLLEAGTNVIRTHVLLDLIYSPVETVIISTKSPAASEKPIFCCNLIFKRMNWEFYSSNCLPVNVNQLFFFILGF